MLGAVIIVLVLVIAIPVGFLMTMSIVAAVLGWTVGDEVDHLELVCGQGQADVL